MIGLLSAGLRRRASGDAGVARSRGADLEQARAPARRAHPPRSPRCTPSPRSCWAAARTRSTARLRKLRGYPVVVNKWGSWCAPCRAEFPCFQSQSVKHGKQVAFLGRRRAGQQRERAQRSWSQFPVAYPSLHGRRPVDRRVLRRRCRASRRRCSTTAKGQVAYVKQGSYPDEAALAADIRPLRPLNATDERSGRPRCRTAELEAALELRHAGLLRRAGRGRSRPTATAVDREAEQLVAERGAARSWAPAGC